MKIKMIDKQNLVLVGKKERVLVSKQAKVWENSVSKKSRIIVVDPDLAGADLSTWLVEDRVVIRGVGDYEVGGVAVSGYSTNGCVLYVVNIDGVKVGCLNSWVDRITDKTVEKVADLDVLVVRLPAAVSTGKKEIIETAKVWGVNYLILMAEVVDNPEVADFLDLLDREDLKAVEEVAVDPGSLPDGMEVNLLSKSDE